MCNLNPKGSSHAASFLPSKGEPATLTAANISNHGALPPPKKFCRRLRDCNQIPSIDLSTADLEKKKLIRSIVNKNIAAAEARCLEKTNPDRQDLWMLVGADFLQ
jgi:hypothetical protein